MTEFSLKIKLKNDQHILKNINSSFSIGNLKKKISETTNIPVNKLNILMGYPPKPLDISNNNNEISTIGIKSAESLIIEESKSTESEKIIESVNQLNETQQSVLPDISNNIECENHNEYMEILLKKIVPADNSCLFTSIGFVLNGKVDTDSGSYMREIIASHVASDPETYNEAILGKPNKEYCDWILKSDSWGGAIEVSVLSNFYGIEIDVVDITNAIINRFGEDKSYGQRVFLLFDGIHYDPLYMESIVGGPPKTIFPMEDIKAFSQAEELALEAKSSRQFTDVNKFTLRCLQCDCKLVGTTNAQQHAKSTGHSNFGEI